MRFLSSLPSLAQSKFPLTLAAFSSLLFGCATSPSSQVDSIDVPAPEYWVSESQKAEVDMQKWLSDFNDPVLESIIKEALENNYNLDVAAARLEQARASAMQAGIDIFPQVTLNSSASRALRNNSSGLRITDSKSDSFAINARVSWELDVWGKVRNTKEAGIASWEAANEDFRSARLSLAARTAQLWYSSVEAQLLLDLTKETLGTYEEALQTVEANFKRGVARALDVRLLRANVASAMSSYEQRLRRRDASVRSIEILLGRYPANELEIATNLPELAESIPAGLPSEILWRRPDLVAAERNLAASLMRKKVAVKSNYPTFSLTGSGGTSTSDLSDILNDDFKVWNLALNLAQPIFPSSRLKNGVIRARAVYEQNIASYANAVLVAFKEVEDSLNEQVSYKREFDAQAVAQEQSMAAVELAWSEYRKGLTGITTLLDSERRSISSQISFIQVANSRVQSRIALYLALGGGFELPQE